MNNNYVIYDINTGRVKRAMWGSQRENEAGINEETLDSTGMEHDMNSYVDLGGPTLLPRTAMGASWDKQAIVADGLDLSTLTGLPTNRTVYVNTVPHAVTDGVFELGADDPGKYVVVVNELAFLREEWIINAD